MAPASGGSRLEKQRTRHRTIATDMMAEGTIKIERLADRHRINLMTIHRGLDELVTALPTGWSRQAMSSATGREEAEKGLLACRTLSHSEPGQSIPIDESTTTARTGSVVARSGHR